MELNRNGLNKKEEWLKAGYMLPEYNRDEIMKNTKERPFWIHFGAGNIFRAFQANVVQKLLNRKVLDCGLVVAEGYDYEIVEKMNRPHEEYSILVTLKADGSVEKTVVGSVMESCMLDSANSAEYQRLREIFCKPSLQMASFTITEKGYSLTDGNGAVLPAVETDFANGPEKPVSYMGKIASLLYARFQSEAKPIAMVSMDNCSHNGDKLKAAICAFAQSWEENGLAAQGFFEYVSAGKKVSFPWSMIDKITPRPDAAVEKILKQDGVKGLEPVITSKNTYVAPFVNAEECEYLVIEDDFPNGRPALEQGGFMFTARETVDKVEKMKVCTCLNPLHTALAVFGCLLGYTKISEEMKDARLVGLVKAIGYREGLPVVTDPGILNPKEFIDTVLQVRIPNPFMPDTPQRIATDTSQKLAIRFGETIKAYVSDPSKDVKELTMIPLVFAGWLRYLLAVDDEGREISLSPDPLLDTLCSYVEQWKTAVREKEASREETDASREEIEASLRPILENEKIFGVNLYQVGLADLVCEYFMEMLKGRGAVRRTLLHRVKPQ